MMALVKDPLSGSITSTKKKKKVKERKKKEKKHSLLCLHYLCEVPDFLDHLLAANVKPGDMHWTPGVVHQTVTRQHALQQQYHRQSLQLPLADLQGKWD